MRIGVVGAGVMGIGVTQCLAAAGHSVTTVDSDRHVLADGAVRLRTGLRQARLLGRSTAAFDDVLSRVRWTNRLSDVGDAEFVIECVRERIADKREVFCELDTVCPQQTIFASCTSAVSIALLAKETGRPDRVLGTHFMNPAPLKDTVEVVRTKDTSDQTMGIATRLLATMGKSAIVVADAPGFVTNRVLMLTINEAATVVHQGTATAAQVDAIFANCFGHPMGPLRTADLIGLDTVVDSLDVLHEQTGDHRFVPCPLLTELVAAGHTGRKSGRGFHQTTLTQGDLL